MAFYGWLGRAGRGRKPMGPAALGLQVKGRQPISCSSSLFNEFSAEVLLLTLV